LRAGSLAAAFACLTVPDQSLAQRQSFAQRTDAPADDGVYGRLSRDTTLSVEVGGGLGLSNGAPRGAFTTTLRARSLDTGGVFLAYQLAPGDRRHDALALGLDLRMLTLARIFQDMERGPRTLDLFLDSIGLELGAAWVRPGLPWGQGSGIAWVLGAGAEIPLAWRAGDAMCLRAGVRWVHSTGADALAPSATPDDAVFVTATLVLRAMANLGHVRSTP
jgi:hypothetical protein